MMPPDAEAADRPASTSRATRDPAFDTRTSQAPYPGLRHFRREESDIFFGREALIDALLLRLERQRFLGIVGVSGCGKSSLVRAGLVPALETGFLADAGVNWEIVKMRPGDRPLRALARELCGVLPCAAPSGIDQAPFIEDSLRRGPLGLCEVLREHEFDPQVNLLLVVDQFEEIFRYRRDGDPNEADALVALLLASARSPAFRIYVVLAMRSDYLGECAVFPGLPEALNDCQVLTPRLTREQRREAIELAAGVFGARIEPALVNQVLNDMGAGFDRLPLMQHLLMRMWNHAALRQQPVRALGMADYEAVGGFAAALQRHVEEVFNSLARGEQTRIAEVLFRAATERVENKQDSRRPVHLGEVAELAGVPWQQVAAVVEVFRRTGNDFLLPPDGVTLDPSSIIDLTHESLIRQWDRLAGWVRDEALRAESYGKITDDARIWRDRRKSRGWLLSSDALDEALAWRHTARPTAAWARRYGDDFALVEEFLQKSVRGRRWRILGRATTIALCVLAAGWWIHDRAQAMREKAAIAAQAEETRARMGLAYDLAHQSNLTRTLRLGLLDTSALLAVEAVQLYPSLQASQALRESLRILPRRPSLTLAPTGKRSGDAPRPQAGALRVGFARDGAVLLVGDGTALRRIDAASGQEMATWRCVDCQQMRLLAISPNGQYLVVADETTLLVVNAETGARVGRPIGVPGAKVLEAAVGADGGTVAVRTDHDIRLLAVDGGRRAQTIALGDGGRARLDPQARFALTWSRGDSQVAVVDLTKGGAAVAVWNLGNLKITHVTFSPDGGFVAAVTQERAIRIWDVHRGFELTGFNVTNYPAAVDQLYLGWEARQVALVADETTRVFDLRAGSAREVSRIEGVGTMLGASFSPDGRRFAAVNQSGVRMSAGGRSDVSEAHVRMWELAAGDELARFVLPRPVSALAISPDKRLVATVSREPSTSSSRRGDGLEWHVVVWQVASERPLLEQRTEGAISELRFSADSRSLLFGGDGGRLFRLPLPAASGQGDAARSTDSASPSDLVPLSLACGPDTRLVAISGDGARVASAGRDGKLCVYDTNGALLAKLAAPSGLVALSHTGEYVGSVGLDRQLRWLHVKSASRQATAALPMAAQLQTRQQTLLDADAPALALAISPNGSFLALSTWKPGAAVRGVDAAFNALQVAPDSVIEALAFNDAETLLVTGGSDANARVWALPTATDPLRELARIAHRDPVGAVALSADDELLATASGSVVRVLRWRHLDLAAEACARVSRNITGDEWQQYMQGRPYEHACANIADPDPGTYREQAVTALSAGKVREAVALYAQAAANGEAVDAADWNELCWTGSLWGHAGQVMGACNLAIAAAPDDPAIHDSRGLAHALLGQSTAAIDDLQVLVNSGAASARDRAQRQRWITALANHTEPLTLQEIRSLRGH